MSRLTILHINIIGIVVALIVFGGMWFTVISNAQEARTKAQAEAKAVQDDAAQLPQAKNELAKAIKDRDVATKAWTVYEKQYMPMIGYTDNRMTTMMKVFWPNNGKSWPERFRKTFSNYMNSEGRRSKVRWMNPDVLTLGPYGPDPNKIDAGRQGEGLGPVLHYDLPIQVEAPSIQALMSHMKNWPSIKFAGVPTVSGLQISGNSPNLVANYRVTLTIIVRDKIPAEDGRVSGGGSSGGGAGGGFGGAGGRPSLGSVGGGSGGAAASGGGGGGGKMGGMGST